MPELLALVGPLADSNLAARPRSPRALSKRWSGENVVLSAVGHSRSSTDMVVGNEEVWLLDGEHGFASEWREACSGRGESPVREVAAPGSMSGASISWNSTRGELCLRVDAAACFDLYYSQVGDSILASTKLLPIAKGIRAAPDPVGICQQNYLGYCVGARTAFAGIKRVRAGEVVVISSHGRPVRYVKAASPWDVRGRVFSGDGAEFMRVLRETVGARADRLERGALMVSGGWDSRLLAEAMGTWRERMTACYFGEISSFEAHIARAVGHVAARQVLLLELDHTFLGSREVLCELIEDAETATFPYWRRAALLLRENGCDAVMSGVMGEVLGGQYYSIGETRFQRALSALRRDYDSSQPAELADDKWLNATLKIFSQAFEKPADRLQQEWKNLVAEAREQALLDIRDEFERLRGMGIVHCEALLECFISTHRGAKEIFQQVRTMRAYLDVSLPFSSDVLLKMACATPMRFRRQNRLTRSMLLAALSTTSHLPLAATFMPPSAPLLAHEIFRLVRRAIDRTARQVFLVSGKRLGSPGLFGWLQSDCWVQSSGAAFCPENLSMGTLISPEWMRRWRSRLASGSAVLGQAKGFLGIVTLEMLYESANAYTYSRCTTAEAQEGDLEAP